MAITLLLVALGLGLDVAQGTRLDLGTGFTLAFVAVLLPLGVLVAFRQPANPIGWIFLGVAVTVGLGGLAGGYADYWTSGEGGSNGLGKLAAWYGSSSVDPLGADPGDLPAAAVPGREAPRPALAAGGLERRRRHRPGCW